MPLGRRITSRKAASVTVSMPTTPRSSMTTLRSSTRMTTLSPNMVGSTLTREIDRVPADGKPDAAVLRHAALGDVEVRHDLDARGDGEGQVARRRHHFIEHAVGTDADFELVLERLEVQVAGVVLDGHQEDHVQQLADRGAVGQGLGLGQVERAFFRPPRPPRPGRCPAPCRRSAPRRSRRRPRSSGQGLEHVFFRGHHRPHVEAQETSAARRSRRASADRTWRSSAHCPSKSDGHDAVELGHRLGDPGQHMRAGSPGRPG